MQKIISFSIAAYNIEPYAKQLLDSFIEEKSMSEIEVLIINDGSKDLTTTVCQEYVKNYPSVFKLINKENGGHGSTINNGIDLASGKYFKPIDGDDWIMTSNLYDIVNILRDIEVDVVVTDYDSIFEKSQTTKTIRTKFLSKNEPLKFDSIVWKDFLKYHSIMYRTQLLKEHNIKLTEKIFYEDTEYDLYPIVYVDTLFYIPKVLYCYRMEREGQSVSASGFLKHKEDYKTMLINVLNYTNEWENKVSKQKVLYFKHLKKTVLMYFFRMTSDRVWKEKAELMLYKQNTLTLIKQIDKRMFYKYWFYSFFRVRLVCIIRKFFHGKI